MTVTEELDLENVLNHVLKREYQYPHSVTIWGADRSHDGRKCWAHIAFNIDHLPEDGERLFIEKCANVVKSLFGSTFEPCIYTRYKDKPNATV